MHKKPGKFSIVSVALSAVLGLLSPGTEVWAIYNGAGTSGAQFLKLGAGSRCGAMAEACTALADDAYALYYNPAGITNVKEAQLGAAHTSFFQGTSYEVGNFVYPLPSGREKDYSRHVLGFGLYNLSVSDIERRTGDTTSHLGTFSAGDYAYAASYAYRMDRRLGLGLTGKAISQTIDTYSSSAFAVDMGAQFTPLPDSKRPVSVAATITNLGSRPRFAGADSDPLPMGVTLGAGMQIIPKKLHLEVDMTKYNDTNAFFAVGGEYRRQFSEGLSGAFRSGYSNHRTGQDGLNGVTLGIGVSFYRAGFDFAWIPFGDLGNTFRYSLMIRFGQASPEAK